MADNKFHVYIEAGGSSGDATEDGRFAVRTPDATAGSTQDQYSLDQTVDANGKIEVRLRFVTLAMTPGPIRYPRFTKYSAHFDDLSLTP